MQCVIRVDGYFSKHRPVTAGVAHGLVIDPLLFSLFINDIVGHSCSYHLYAEDVQLYLTSNPSTSDSSIARLNEVLDRIHQWYLANRLIINPPLLPIDVSP
jgi:hypothetical protein